MAELLALLVGGAALVLRPDAVVEVRDGTVRLGDVAASEGAGALPAGLAERIVATFPSGRDSILLSRPALVTLVERAAPGTEVAGAAGGPVLLRRASRRGPSQESGCFALAAPVSLGAALAPADLVPASCGGGKRSAPLAFDRQSGVARAAADLPAETYLGRLVLGAVPDFHRGDSLTLVSTAGVVRIERAVIALQPGKAGGRLFVRDSDGEVLVAPAVAAPPEREREDR